MFGLILFAVLLSCGWGLLGVVVGSLFRVSLSDALVSGMTAIGVVIIVLASFLGHRLGRRRRSKPAPTNRSDRSTHRPPPQQAEGTLPTSADESSGR